MALRRIYEAKKQFKHQRLVIFIKESYTSAYNNHDHNEKGYHAYHA